MTSVLCRRKVNRNSLSHTHIYMDTIIEKMKRKVNKIKAKGKNEHKEEEDEERCNHDKEMKDERGRERVLNFGNSATKNVLCI